MPHASLICSSTDAPLWQRSPNSSTMCPNIPAPDETPPSWAPFLDGYDSEEAAAGHEIV